MKFVVLAFSIASITSAAEGQSLYESWSQNRTELSDRFSRSFELNQLAAVIEACLNNQSYETEADEGQRSEAHRAYYTATSVDELSDGVRDRAISALDASRFRTTAESSDLTRQLLTREAEQRATARAIIERMPSAIRVEYCRSSLQEGAFQLGAASEPGWDSR